MKFSVTNGPFENAQKFVDALVQERGNENFGTKQAYASDNQMTKAENNVQAIDLLLKAGAADKVLPQEESDDPGKV